MGLTSYDKETKMTNTSRPEGSSGSPGDRLSPSFIISQPFPIELTLNLGLNILLHTISSLLLAYVHTHIHIILPYSPQHVKPSMTILWFLPKFSGRIPGHPRSFAGSHWGSKVPTPECQAFPTSVDLQELLMGGPGTPWENPQCHSFQN